MTREEASVSLHIHTLVPQGGEGGSSLTHTLSPQVVPSRLRSSAYAFDGCISGAFGAAAAPIVGLIAAAGGFSQRVAQVRVVTRARRARRRR